MGPETYILAYSYVFWTDTSSIARMGMDGSNLDMIITDITASSGGLRGLTLDPLNERIWWYHQDSVE